MAVISENTGQEVLTIPEAIEERPSWVVLLRRPIWIDVIVLIALAAIVYLLISAASGVVGPKRPTLHINLSIKFLPKYIGWSLFRGVTAYFLSLTFTIIYGYIAAKSRRAEKIMIPVLDILQSIPVLGFMPSVLLALIAIFPNSNLGLELTSIIMIFTGQVWNMTFSFYHSLRSIPSTLQDAARMYKFSWWRRFWKLELPYATIPLVWNSMMGMAGGWFFLTICETFRLGNYDFRLPGIGSYMWEAIEQDNIPAMLYGVGAMVILILLIDQLIWKPIVAWAQKFRYEDSSAQAPASVVLELLKQSTIIKGIENIISKADIPTQVLRKYKRTYETKEQIAVKSKNILLSAIKTFIRYLALILLLYFVFRGGIKLLKLISAVEFHQWVTILMGGGLTFTRVVGTLILASLWTIPLGVIIGLKPKVSRVMQPVIMILASFPAPMIYPLILKLLNIIHIPLSIGSVFLLTLGAQWYILFNAVAGASRIPKELEYVTHIYKFSRLKRWSKLYLPAILPSLITGWISAAGGAWNASIVAEYIHTGGKILEAFGLGAIISKATEQKELHILAAGVMVMATIVVLVNRFFWEPLFRRVSERNV